MKFSLSQFLIFTLVLTGLTACGGSSGGGGSSSSCNMGIGAATTISGKVTFDRVPLDVNGGLDFLNTTIEPAQGVTIQAICNSEISSTTTDSAGNYSLTVPAGTNGVFVRAKAEMKQTGTPAWDVTVLDESQLSDVVFVMDGSPFNIVNTGLIRNLHAPSGFDGTNYTSARVAGPFAILDTIRKAQNLVLGVNASAIFPPLQVKWSEISITGTFYTRNTISVLGRTSDTDEYDEHVIAHEWGHYFQDAFSRDDSIGGQHSQGDILDIRVAFSEGFGNAFSAMVTGDPVYKDSQAVSTTVNVGFRGFFIDVESNACTNEGWYNECSVQSVLLDLFDDTNETNDVFSLGFTEIHDVLVNDMPSSSAFSSIFSFIAPFKSQSSISGLTTDVDNLLTAQSIDQPITDDIGSGASSGSYTGSAQITPVYLTGSFPLSNVCSNGENGTSNKLALSRFISFTAPSDGSFTFQASRDSGTDPSDPDIYLFLKGLPVVPAGSGESTVANFEEITANLIGGEVYVLEVRNYNYDEDPDFNLPTSPIETCFTITRTAN